MSEDAHPSDNQWPEFDPDFFKTAGPIQPRKPYPFPPPHHKPSEWPPQAPPEDPSWAPLDHLIQQIEQAYQECSAGPLAPKPYPSTATIPSDLALATLVFNSGDVVQAILRTPTQPTYHAEILDRHGRPRRARLRFERFMHADLARPIYLEAAPQDC